MNLSELQSVQARERTSDSLQELRPTFYQDVADFVGELRDERERVAADTEDPFEDPEVTKLTDDIRTAEGTIEAIYERRVGKVVKLASLAASDMPTEEDGLTTEERALYEMLVEAIESHRAEVLATFTQGTSTGTPAVSADDRSGADSRESEAETTAGADRRENEADTTAGADSRENEAETTAGADSDDGSRTESGDDVSGVGEVDARNVDTESNVRPGGVQEDEEDLPSEPTDSGPTDDKPANGDVEPPTSDLTERTTVRITEDVGAILGVDEREYDLATDDVVTLPAENATPLIERDAAEPIE